MAYNVKVAGAFYSGVPAISVQTFTTNPQVLTANSFYATNDATATASDIASGKTAYVNGGMVTGTASGGGTPGFSLIGTLSLGPISTSNTTATDTGKSITVKGVYDYDLLICECSVDTKVNNRHAATTRVIWLTGSNNITTKNGQNYATSSWHCKLSSTGVATTRSGTTAYGVYASGCTLSDGSQGDNGQAVIPIYTRYSSTNSGTINGDYTMRVYGVKLYDLIGG